MDLLELGASLFLLLQPANKETAKVDKTAAKNNLFDFIICSSYAFILVFFLLKSKASKVCDAFVNH